MMTIPIQQIGASSAPIDTHPEKVLSKRYYSTMPTIVVRTSLGRIVQDEMNGARVSHIGEKFAQFTPAAVPGYGCYETTDPEEQASLEKYVAEGGEFLSEDEFKRRTTKPEDVIVEQRKLLDDQRQRIEALQAQLQAQQFGDSRRAELLADVKPTAGKSK